MVVVRRPRARRLPAQRSFTGILHRVPKRAPNRYRPRAAVAALGRRLAAVDGPHAQDAAATPRSNAGRPAPAKKAAAAKKAGPAKKAAATMSSMYPSLPGDRLLVAPVFVLSSVRSGSTLLRVMLGTHSKIHAPHELFLNSLEVTVRGGWARHSMGEIGMDGPQLQHLLWDRLMHREMVRHGKSVVVNKTPRNVFHWRRVLQCWPDARFIYLLRHPAATAASWTNAHPNWPADRIEKDVLRYMRALERVRTAHDGGLTVRYEDLTTQPEVEIERLCAFIGVDAEPAMIDYGQADHGSFGRGIGDWSSKIRSGRVQPVTSLPSPDEIPARLVGISRTWGYLTDEPAEIR